MATGNSAQGAWKSRLQRLGREPVVHFFVIGVLLFVVHRAVAGDPRVIVVSGGVEAELARRFQDHHHRPPTPAELETALREWKYEEVLYREALREGLDQDDATVRKVLADKLRARLALEEPRHEPTDAELRTWLATHENLYEVERRYECEWASFPKSAPSVSAELEKYEQALKEGKNPSTSARPLFGRRMSTEQLREVFGAGLAERIPRFPLEQWQRAEHGDQLLLLRVKAVEGGTPDFKAIRPLLLADWTLAREQAAIARATQRRVERYRFEERR
ncbi:MAG TPA: hypothetical protein VGK73_05200 [Polyangiaceae bacterium]